MILARLSEEHSKNFFLPVSLPIHDYLLKYDTHQWYRANSDTDACCLIPFISISVTHAVYLKSQSKYFGTVIRISSYAWCIPKPGRRIIL
jgi:hypothetical protein